jgi:hypothetical protein
MHATVTSNYEQVLINIARTLPTKRAEQLIDFARFLESQSLSEKLMQGEDIAKIEADNAQWDALMATDESQNLLEKLAAEALAEHQAGQTKEYKPQISQINAD